MARPSLTRAHRVLLGLVAAGACLISGIGFAGSYNAVRELAMEKGFGAFSYAFPIGVDAGIVVLLSLDLVLTWLRIPFPLLRQTAWLLTAATIAFNAAASWGDALGMSMHAVIPVLFVVVVEASRHAVGRIAAITADRHMESVRLMRWLLSPVPTFRLWRRMKLWELRSYDETVRLEQNRLVYRAQLRFRYGRGWRRSAPFQALLPLKLAKYGVPLDPSILDRIDGPLEVAPIAPPAPAQVAQVAQPSQVNQASPAVDPAPVTAAVAVPTLAKLAAVRLRDAQEPAHEDAGVLTQPQPELNVWMARAVPPHAQQPGNGARVPGQMSPWFKPPRVPRPTPTGPAQEAAAQPQAQPRAQGAAVAATQIGRRPVRIEQLAHESVAPQPVSARQAAMAQVDDAYVDAAHGDDASGRGDGEQLDTRDGQRETGATTRQGDLHESDRRSAVEPLDPQVCFAALLGYIDLYGQQPDVHSLAEHLTTEFGVVGSRPDGSVNPAELDRIWPLLQKQYVASGRD